MDTPAAERLRLTEIFLSVQGEARAVGWPTVFVRLTGCPLRCQYCDTAYAFHGGEWWEIETILAEVARHGVRHVCVTGGEPLAQKRCLVLLERLCDAGYEVSLETSGAIDVAGVDPRVRRVVDLKTPASLEMHRNLLCEPAAADRARPGQVRDLRPRRLRMGARHGGRARRWPRAARCCSRRRFDQVAPRELAEWILADKLPVRFQMQLHKQLWGDAQGR